MGVSILSNNLAFLFNLPITCSLPSFLQCSSLQSLLFKGLWALPSIFRYYHLAPSLFLSCCNSPPSS